MAEIKFSKEEKALLVVKIQRYFDAELDQEIGQFEADFLLDFFSKEVGAYFYNRGLIDAQAVLARRLEDVAESIYELEQPTEFSK